MNTLIQLSLGIMLLGPILGGFLQWALPSQTTASARYAGYCVGISFLCSLGLLSYFSLSNTSTNFLLMSLNKLNLVLSSLVLLVSFIVHRFSLRYMDGDRLYKRFFLYLSTLTLCAAIMVLADNLLLFWLAWSLSNLFLVLLMIHKKEWRASKHSGLLTFYTLTAGSICLLIAFILLSLNYSTSSLEMLLQLPQVSEAPLATASISFIMLAALSQSGLFPLHRWLISSLNSPTPVSALMHAGLVNGGGILLVKFAPLLMHYPKLLIIVFLSGSLSALLGTVWKLMQHDIKKMLACSTLAQMGFMMMQCGVGLFAAAIAHLCWHGLFKAYLFLNAGSAVKQNKAEATSSNVSLIMLFKSFTGGLCAMVSFALITHKPLALDEASTFVLFFAFIAGSQMMLTWLRSNPTFLQALIGLALTVCYGGMYGASIQLIQSFIPNLATLHAPKLSIMHWSIMILFGSMWALFNFGMHQRFNRSHLGCWIYMNLFNLSQPARKTVTALRNHYKY